MGSLSFADARTVLEHLEEALTLLDERGQKMIATQVQYAIDLLRQSSDIDETTSVQINP